MLYIMRVRCRPHREGSKQGRAVKSIGKRTRIAV